jgi:hypothetical protein
MRETPVKSAFLSKSMARTVDPAEKRSIARTGDPVAHKVIS